MRNLVVEMASLVLILAGAAPDVAARRGKVPLDRIQGMWRCKLGRRTLALGVLPNGRLGLETLSAPYRLKPGKIEVLQGMTWVSYPYRLRKHRRRGKDRLHITMPNKLKLKCGRLSGRQVGQLRGMLCSWSGSSSSYSGASYSHSKRVYFDGRGWFTFTSQGSFSSRNGLSYAKSKAKLGMYRVLGKRVVVIFPTGALAVARVHMRQRNGRITELKYNGTLFASSLCK